MTYYEILNELCAIGLKDRFVSEYEKKISKKLLGMLKETDKIHGTGNLIRSLMDCYESESIAWKYWQLVLIYFLTPLFCRNMKKLRNDLKILSNLQR